MKGNGRNYFLYIVYMPKTYGIYYVFLKNSTLSGTMLSGAQVMSFHPEWESYPGTVAKEDSRL